MDLICGRNLHEVVRTESMSFVRVIDIVSQVLSGLAAAHDRGIIHGDIKPENILLVPTRDGRGAPLEQVKVCDFGITQVHTTADAADAASRAGVICGTAEFMSPEQARGLPLDPRSDLYACGILLYELVTGRVPFTGDTAVAVALKQIEEQPAPPSLVRAGIPTRLEQVILQALAKKPVDRPPTARLFRAQLATALDASREPAGPSAFADEETLPELSLEAADTTVGLDPIMRRGAPTGGAHRVMAAAVVRSWRRLFPRLRGQ